MDDRLREILSVGKSLSQEGSDNWALLRPQALAAIEAIERAGRVVLGGDVWLYSNSKLFTTGDSWHFDPKRERSGELEVRESAAKARSYINDYPEPTTGIAHFELVVQ